MTYLRASPAAAACITRVTGLNIEAAISGCVEDIKVRLQGLNRPLYLAQRFLCFVIREHSSVNISVHLQKMIIILCVHD